MSRVGKARLLGLAEELSQQERALIEALAEMRLATHRQLALLVPSGEREATLESDARQARRMLARLTALGIFKRLERRVGGLRAGSAGYVYFLGSAGERLVAYWRGRGLVKGRHRPEPGSRFVRHRLAVSELWVQAKLQDRRGAVELLAFQPEPASWRRLIDGFGGGSTLKPDAFIDIGLGGF